MKEFFKKFIVKILVGIIICISLISCIIYDKSLSYKKELKEAQRLAVHFHGKYKELQTRNDDYRAKLEKYKHLKQIKDDLSKDIPLKTKPLP